MGLSENITNLKVYEQLKSKTKLTCQELLILARYPYVPLNKMFGELYDYEYRKIKEIEDWNVFYFMNTIKIVCGFGSHQEVSSFQQLLLKEPLRTAVTLSKLEKDPTDRLITFLCNAIRIMLSPKDGGNQFCLDPINVGIFGSIPRNFLKSRQTIGDNWYRNFIEIKLDLLSQIVKVCGKSEIFRIMIYSVCYSLYHYSPERYNISNFQSEDTNLKIVLNKFLDYINFYKSRKS